MQSGIRRGRVTLEKRDALLAALADMGIHADLETDRHAWSATVRLADRHRLTVYDAGHLELAQRLGLPLASLDTALREVGSAAGVALPGT